MTRWAVVGLPDDPIPDNPSTVAEQIQHLRNVATTIKAQLDRLPNECTINMLDWESDAAEGFKEVVKALPPDLAALQRRYERVAEALETFNEELKKAKEMLACQLTEAERAQADLEEATAGVQVMRRHNEDAQYIADSVNMSAPPGTPPVSPEPWRGPDFEANLRDAEARLSVARYGVGVTVESFHKHCQTAAAAIDVANNDDLKNDESWFGDAKRGAHVVAGWVNLEDVSLVLAVLGAAAGLVALFVAGPFLAVAGVVLGGLAILCDMVIQFDKAHTGTFTWTDFGKTMALDTLGFVFGVKGLRAVGALGVSDDALRLARDGAKVTSGMSKAATATRAGAVTTLKNAEKQLRIARGAARVERAREGVATAEKTLAAAQKTEQATQAAYQTQRTLVRGTEGTLEAAQEADRLATNHGMVVTIVTSIPPADYALERVPEVLSGEPSEVDRAEARGAQVRGEPIRGTAR